MYKNICRHTSRIRKTSAVATAVTAASPSAAASGASLRLQVATNITQATTSTSLTTTKPVSPRIATDDVRYFTPSRLTSQQRQQPLGKYSEGQLLEYDASPSLLISFVRTMASGSKPPQKSAASQPKHTNRLAMEKSPYLLQHAHNPVDWYPWCEEAFEKARTENKLIFLSVGYSTCHWCHVMEHESFEDEEVAELMNQHFVNIKVDREERPDIDQIYMQFLLAVNNNGGWPMSVWLTPELTPVMAGTYFPPHNRWGMLSFKNVLNLMARQWQENRDKLTTTGNEIVNAMQRSMEGAKAEGHEPAEVETRLEEAIAIFRHRFDSAYGGFGTKPKFPEVSRLNLLFHAYVITKDQDVLDMVLTTLRRIGNGGIHDHVFGGFARYSVDRTWHIPHFEKMLYDQGQLMSSYAHAYMVTRHEEFLERGDGIFEYMMKDLRHPRGGFYAGEDADSLPTADAAEKVEGAFYAWTWQEIKDAMCQRPELYMDIPADKAFVIYSYHYDLKPHGNVAPADDPHGHLTKKNILFVHDGLAETCSKFKISEEQLRHILQVTNKMLHEIRDQRPRPHLDTKIICSWNGLVLSGLSKLANCGSARKQDYLKAAKELVDFLKKYLYDDEKKILLRSSYGLGTNDETLDSAGQERIEGFLVDYAFLIRGLLDYYKASLDGSALHWAKELQDTQDRLFWDSKDSAYFYSHENAPNIIVRLKEESDGAEPSGNSVSAHNLIMLAHYIDDESFKQRSEQLFQYFSGFHHFGHAFPEMMSALMLHDRGLDLVAVVGPDSEETQRFADICRKYYIPGMIIVHVDPEHQEYAYNIKAQDKFKMINGKPTVYICHDKVCRMPETDPEKLEAHLKQNYLNITGQ